MTRDQLIATRQTMVARLPVTGELLRGSLIERTVRHSRGCTICAGGGGPPLAGLTITYACGRPGPPAGGSAFCAGGGGPRLSFLPTTLAGAPPRQFSLRREQVGEVRRW